MNKGNVMPSQSEQSAPAKCPECKTDLNPAGFCDRCGLCPEPHEADARGAGNRGSRAPGAAPGVFLTPTDCRPGSDGPQLPHQGNQ